MTLYKIIKNSSLALAASLAVAGCTKLHEQLTSTVTTPESKEFSNLFLKQAYTDIGLVYDDPSNVDQLEEVTGDEVIIPVRGGDWSDGGQHVLLHQHTWGRQDGATSIFESLFTSLNKQNYDATSVLGTTGTPDQLAQARFIRALALYQLLDFFGQFPLRQPGDDLLTTPPVYSGDSAVQFIVTELNSAIKDLSPSNGTTIANQDAARMLLMKVLLNRGAFNSRANPTFDPADMAQVISLGNTIIGNGHSLETNFFNMFTASTSNTNNPETIFALTNTAVSKTNGTSNYTNMQNRWFATVHYNSYDALAPNAGWNGYSTIGEFYNTFGVNGDVLTQTPNDTSYDQRLGGRFMLGVTDISGMRPGILIGQQYDEKGNAVQDRQNHGLIYTNGSEIPANLTVSGATIETSGFRLLKYSPDFSQQKTSYQNPGNYLILFRLADVMLMVAEAKMRTGGDGLTIVNQLRAVRGAKALTSMTLANTANVYDPNTLLAERGREFWWENQRRTDLIRFGVWNLPWRFKAADNGVRFIFPIPLQDLSQNPNLIPNLQGTTY